jgi:hypothetical protein
VKLCEARGWEHVEYVNNETSASRGRRPSYERMLQDIRDGFALPLRGEALYSIAAQWNDAGVTTPTGGLCRGGTVRQVLLNPRYAGLPSCTGRS